MALKYHLWAVIKYLRKGTSWYSFSLMEARIHNTRLIPVLTILNNQVVKTKSFCSPRYVGDPLNTISIFSNFETEELMIVDISANHGSEMSSDRIIEAIPRHAFMPISFGGGIGNFHRAKWLFEVGFDKVILKSGLSNLKLIHEISSHFGSQALAGCLEYSFQQNSDQQLVNINGKQLSISQAAEWCRSLEALGIGEFVLNNRLRDGTRLGLQDSNMIRILVNEISSPIVSVGGCKDIKDAAEHVRKTGCHSVGLATSLIYKEPRDAILIRYPEIRTWHQELMEVET